MHPTFEIDYGKIWLDPTPDACRKTGEPAEAPASRSQGRALSGLERGTQTNANPAEAGG